MKHIAIYLRVSTGQQHTASQEPELKRWADTQSEPVKWYKDKFTGKTMDRPGMLKLQEAIENDEVSTVAVWSLDRLGRTSSGVTAFFDLLRKHDVNFYSIKQKFDLSTPQGRLMADVLASVAAFETEMRRQRVIAGQAAARAAGKRWGGSEAGRLLKVKPEQIEAVRKMLEAGKDSQTIINATGLKRATFYRIAKRIKEGETTTEQQ